MSSCGESTVFLPLRLHRARFNAARAAPAFEWVAVSDCADVLSGFVLRLAQEGLDQAVENQHQIRNEQQQMYGPQQHVGAGKGKRDHAHDEG